MTFEEPKIVEYFGMNDERGIFLKPYVNENMPDEFQKLQEAYFSTSKKGVFRGLHYQTGVYAQAKYVVCITGEIIDYSIDLRTDSPTFQKIYKFKISDKSNNGVFVPRGFAHGIYAEKDSLIGNFCDNKYYPQFEAGLHPSVVLNASDFENLILSEKDKELPHEF